MNSGITMYYSRISNLSTSVVVGLIRINNNIHYGDCCAAKNVDIH